MLVDPYNLKNAKLNKKGNIMKQRKLWNTAVEVVLGLIVLGVLFWGLKTWDPVTKYNLTWLKIPQSATEVVKDKIEEREVKAEETKEEVKDKPIQSTSRFKVEYIQREATGGQNGIYVVTDKATNQLYIGLSGVALTPVK